MKTTITRSTAIEATPRLTLLEGMFDIPPRQREDLSWEVDLPIEEQANRFPDLPWLKQPVAAS